MMGQGTSGQKPLFYAFKLDDHVPADHLLRGIAHCCPNTPMRKIARSVHESAREVARDVAKTAAYKQSRKDRKKVERLFAHLKRILRLDRLRLRGPNGAHDEYLLAAIAQNLRRMARRLMFAAPEAVPIAA